MQRFKVTFGDIIRRRRVYSVVIHAEDEHDARDRAEGMDFDSIVGCGLARKEVDEPMDAEAPWEVESVELAKVARPYRTAQLAKYRELHAWLSQRVEDPMHMLNEVFRTKLADKLAEIAALDPEE